MKRPVQPALFESTPPLPEGFKYQPNFLSPEEERDLVRRVETLPFEGFEFQGFLGKRRVASFGWRYDFNERQLQKADDLPPFLLPLRERAAAFAGLGPADFQHALVTEYGPGAGIGWHRDKAVFDEVVGVSLLSPCSFRLRRKKGAKWERATVVAEPRSAYLLSGPARTEWEHSIPAMDRLRYSITFRNFRDPARGASTRDGSTTPPR
jgi:alkylated DNA repair dioxygenase AlkB